MKYRTFSFLVILLIFFCTDIDMALAQQYTLSGTVTDQSGTPVENVSIYLAEEQPQSSDRTIPLNYESKTVTNRNGRYSIKNVSAGPYQLIAYYPGKRTQSKQITIDHRDAVQNFKLEKFEDMMDEVVIGGQTERTSGITRLRSVEGVTINESKKNEVLVIDDMTVNKATNNSRQVYAKVPGLNIWQTDDAGVQTSVGGRGLSPKRNSNFNTRQNGYDIAADALGYPESYYTPPVQALERIEIIRGAASLQYGTQFGGMLNFEFKDGPDNTPFRFSSKQSYGSFGLFNSFNSVGGTIDEIGYYGFYQYKTSDGWRPNAELDQHTAYLSFDLDLTPDLTITPEYTYMYYLAHQPGGLTDAQFRDDPSQSNRDRNWFRVNWNLFALKADYDFSSMTRLNTRFFGLLGGRDALGNLQRIDRLDHGGKRNLLKDDFENWGNETRLIHRYHFIDGISVILAGTRFYNGYTHRRQGSGGDGSDPTFRYLNPDNVTGSDFDLPSQNRSVFVENIFNITPKFSITPGARFEYIRTEAEGYYRNIVRDLAGNILVDERIAEQRSRDRSFLFFGIGSSYRPGRQLEIYGNFSQNYRAINFNDIRVDIGSLEVDPDIQDERGFNVDLGIRGQVGKLFSYDLTAFHLSYEDRIGTVLRTEPNPKFNNLVERTFRYRTNIADAGIYGIESFAEADLFTLMGYNSKARLSLFTNLSLIEATYTNTDEPGIEGNDVELVPPFNFKTGLTFSQGSFEASYQFSYVAEHFSDATNARQTPTAIEGIIPSYKVMDLSAKYRFDRFTLEGGINNLTNEKYFTRRATGYPGPGIIPAKIRNFYITAGIQI
ncbi:Fe(3+) dicitrate transport protein [Fodinibius roseus]|uniref:Fe(3+) dicitrate transport protein n=1 Tax=Fodinibius roseus TaxID=1194090 RepID=A0A1M4UGN1_9BACT|nr:TonB-dependent receptor [Fodinibius roseus]SHE55837.1 Fe(3+) dicitrate transport protein [Fodinibius roseus]